MDLFSKCGRSWEDLASLSDSRFAEALGSAYHPSRHNKIPPDWAYLHQEMAKSDVTLTLLHQEYLQQLADTPERAYQYSQFVYLYRRSEQQQRCVMRQVQQPTEKMLVDFCGRTVSITDAATGKTVKAQIFVSVIGRSGCIFAYAVPSQKADDWLECHTQAFAFYGGVPKYLVCDNLKSAVISHNRYGIKINRFYEELADYYGFAVAPTRVRKPQDKGAVESAVRYVQRSVLAAMRDWSFFSFEELNQELKRRVMALNQHPPKNKALPSRWEHFEQVDLPALQPLPVAPMNTVRCRYAVTVPKDYHIEFDGAYYSVPHHYIGSKVDVRLKSRTVEILLGKAVIATHRYLTEPKQRSTDEAHQPPNHRHYSMNEPEQLKQWADRLGGNTAVWVHKNLQRDRNFANGYKAVCKLRRWVDDSRPDMAQLDKACALALKFERMAFSLLLRLMESGNMEADLNKLMETEAKKAVSRSEHQHIRGAAYYRNAGLKEK